MGVKASLTGVLNERVLAACRERVAARLEKSVSAMVLKCDGGSRDGDSPSGQKWRNTWAIGFSVGVWERWGCC